MQAITLSLSACPELVDGLASYSWATIYFPLVILEHGFSAKFIEFLDFCDELISVQMPSTNQ